jgi:hypothetical protein
MKVVKIKPIPCVSCQKDFIKTRGLQRACSLECAIIDAKKKQELKEEKDWQKRKKEGKEKLKKLSIHEKEARTVFQKYIRLRDVNQPCISCGVTEDDCWQGSHFYKAEIFSGLIFNEMNVHKSCLRCNFFLNGNELGYREGLVKRYGEQYVKELELLKDESRDYKYTKEELTAIKNYYQLKLKEL